MPQETSPIKVSCALIIRGGCVFSAQRAPHKSMPLLWEFPGGKVEDKETIEQSIVRELREELSLDVVASEVCPSFIYDYGDFEIELIPVICKPTEFVYELRDHVQVGWFDRESALSLDWCPADEPIIEYVFKRIKEGI